MTAPLEMTEHISDSELAAMVEYGPERVERRVVEHVADCGECREALMMASEIREEMAAEENVKHGDFGGGSGTRWKVLASAAALAAALFVVFGAPLRERWFGAKGTEALAQASRTVRYRATEGRLSGFPYQERRVMRGAKPGEEDLSLYQVEAAAAKILRDPEKDLHAVGVAYLVMSGEKRTYIDNVGVLERALAKASPDERAAVANDLAVALIARGSDADLERAVALTRNLQTPEAAFNHAKALELLGRNKEALAAYDAYLKVETDPQWIKEGQKNRDFLLQLNPQLGSP